MTTTNNDGHVVDNNGVSVQLFFVTQARFRQSIATLSVAAGHHCSKLRLRVAVRRHQRKFLRVRRRPLLHGQRRRRQLPWDIHLVGVVVL